MGFPGGLVVKNLPASAGDTGRRSSIPGLGRSLEKEAATHFSILSWKIPWTEEPGRLQSRGSQRLGHNWSDWASAPLFFRYVVVNIFSHLVACAFILLIASFAMQNALDWCSSACLFSFLFPVFGIVTIKSLWRLRSVSFFLDFFFGFRFCV